MNIKRQRVGGLTFIRVYLFGRNFVFSFCRTQKSHILIA